MIGDEHMAVQSTLYLPQISEEVKIMDYSFDNSILVESGVYYENNDNVHQIVTTPQKCASKKYLFIDC